MYIFVIIFIFTLGLILGSFVNALEYRISKKMTMGGRSICPSCKHQLSVVDLVPLFSWIYLRGKCRYCKKSISPQYPIVELLSGLSLLHLSFYFGLLSPFVSMDSFITVNWSLFGIKLAVISTISTILILIALHDYKTGYVLSYYAYVAIALALALISFPSGSFIGWTALLPYIYCSIGAAAPFAILWAVSRGKWMGAGDIEIALLVGILLGWPNVITGMYFAFIVGSMVGLSLVLNKKTSIKSEIAFGPFLIAGIYFALSFGKQISDMYVKIFLG